MGRRNDFCNPETEQAFLREFLYWSTIEGRNLIEELCLEEEQDLFTGDQDIVWKGLLASYTLTGEIERGPARSALPERLRARNDSWLLGDTEYALYTTVPFAKWLQELKVLRASRRVVATTLFLTDLRDGQATPHNVAYRMCCELEKVVVETERKVDIEQEYDAYRDIMLAGGTWNTGITQLDKRGRFGGYYGIVAARSSHGKTAVMLSFALNQLLHGQSVFYWQGEQTKAQMYLRALCQLTGLPTWKVMRDDDPEHTMRIAKGKRLLNKWLACKRDSTAFYLYDGRRSVGDVLRLLRAAKIRHPIAVGYIDQLSKFVRDQKMHREAAYSDISEAIAIETLRQQQPVLMAHQLNIKERRDITAPPASWQSKDCGRLYEDCDFWITVDRPEMDIERLVAFDAAMEKAKKAGRLEDADTYDVRGRAKLLIEKDRVATIGCHEEWLTFNRTCGRLQSRIGSTDLLITACHIGQTDLSFPEEEQDNEPEF